MPWKSGLPHEEFRHLFSRMLQYLLQAPYNMLGAVDFFFNVTENEEQSKDFLITTLIMFTPSLLPPSPPLSVTTWIYCTAPFCHPCLPHIISPNNPSYPQPFASLCPVMPPAMLSDIQIFSWSISRAKFNWSQLLWWHRRRGEISATWSLPWSTMTVYFMILHVNKWINKNISRNTAVVLSASLD